MRIHECSHAPLSRVFEKASAHVHATCTVFVLPHIVLACSVDKRDHANGVWWITVQFGENPSYAGRCAVGDTRSVGWKSEHRQRSGAKHFP